VLVVVEWDLHPVIAATTKVARILPALHWPTIYDSQCLISIVVFTIASYHSSKRLDLISSSGIERHDIVNRIATKTSI
jgi:hypothetical protein